MSGYELVLPGLHDGQADIEADLSRFKIVVAGRRFGKTRYATRACLRVAAGDRWWKPDDRSPGRAWWVAPTYKVTNEGWDPLRIMARQIPGSKIEISERRIVLPNGGSVEIRSADRPDTLVGAGLDLVILDEAGTMKKTAWKENLRPTLSDKRGAGIFIGTPKGLNWVYEQWEDVVDRAGWARFRKPSWDNRLVFPGGRDDPEIESAREELGSILFDQEYGAEFIDISGGIFKDDWMKVRFAVLPDPDDPEEVVYLVGGTVLHSRDCRRITLIDPAVSTKETADFTAIATVAISPDGLLLVLDVLRAHLEGPEIIPTAVREMKRWASEELLVETVAFQLTLFQEARRQGIPVRKLKADRDKISRALPLAARMESGLVAFREDADWIDELLRELRAFPAGLHDDQVDVLAYAAAEVGLTREWAAY